MTTRKSNDYKITAVNYYLVEDKTQEEVCKIFKCNPRSLMRWVERYKKDGNVNIHYRKPIAYKVKKEYVDFLLQELKNNKTITLQELLQKLKDKYKGVNLTTTQIFRVIKDNNITLKITRIRHEPVKRFGKDIDINTNININNVDGLSISSGKTKYKQILVDIFKTMGPTTIIKNSTFNFKLTNEHGLNGYHWDPCLKLLIQSKCANDTLMEIIRMVKFNKYTIKISIKLETDEIIHFKI